MNNLVIADLHLHSKYSRAVSQKMDLSEIAYWATKKGINLVTTGDWTHPLWFKEIALNLKETSAGIFQLKTDSLEINPSLRFVLSTEVSNIFTQGGKSRRIHTLILSPSLSICEKVQKKLSQHGVNLGSDGRPIMGLTLKELVELLWEVDEKIVVIPAHVWTPWFSLYGSNSGFDSIEEAFGPYAEKIFAVETGLSSDPAMNWSIKELDKRTIISFSDAHSGAKLGREATVFTYQNGSREYSFSDLSKALTPNQNGKLRLAFTIEFFPEEGKYHYSGHRSCQVVLSPAEVKKVQGICPVCRRSLTIGVMDRVQYLTEKLLLEKDLQIKDSASKTKLLFHPTQKKPPFASIIPLLEILGQLENTAPESKKVAALYEQLIAQFKSEFNLLLFAPLEEIQNQAPLLVFKAIEKMRSRQVNLLPGYDGVFGKITVKLDHEAESDENHSEKQASLF